MLSLSVIEPSWQSVFTIPAHSRLRKGANERNKNLRDRSAQITQRFGCYSWVADSVYYYCGSFSKDYKNKSIRSNFEGRVFNYLNNHSPNRNGKPMTNLFIFQNVNRLLRTIDVELKIFSFKRLILSDTEISFDKFSETPFLVLLIEQFLIASFKLQNQCEWNRIRNTP